MNLYKYISSESALKNIVGGKIKFAKINSLNDPTELFPKIYDAELLESLEMKRVEGYNEDDLADLRRQEALFILLAPNEMAIPAPNDIHHANALIRLPIYDDLKYIRSQFNKTVNSISSKCGIFCVSARNNSLPMWAHYAKNGTGFVVEFNKLEDEFTGDRTGILNEVKSVKYKEKKSGINFESGSYNSLFFEKNSDWSYEAEKRIVTNLSSCQEIETDDGGIHVKNIDKKLISKVIFGWKVALNEVSRISEIISEINPLVQIAQADVSGGNIEIEALK